MYSAQFKSWMLFVDGENLTIRGQEMLSEEKKSIPEGQHYKKDVFLWMPGLHGRSRMPNPLLTAFWSIRSYYYTSVVGDTVKVEAVEQSLWNLGFTPRVFKKDKGRSSKGVDITLTTDMLTHAFQDHYDVAVLITSDRDYIPLINEVKHFGKQVELMFFGSAKIDPALKIACDNFDDLTPTFSQKWGV